MEMTCPSRVGRFAGAMYEAQVASAGGFTGDLLISKQGLSSPQLTGALPEPAGQVVDVGFAIVNECGSRQYSGIGSVEGADRMVRRGTAK